MLNLTGEFVTLELLLVSCFGPGMFIFVADIAYVPI